MSTTPIHERTVHFQGSSLASWMLKRLGWTLDFGGLPGRQGVMVVYPHTSNVDFPIGLLAKWAMGLPANFWGKDSLFRIPLFGAWLKWLGGVPVNRSAPGGLVEQAVEHLQRCVAQDSYAWLVVAPEGTRSLTPGWRSGFYRVAHQAGVPLGLATIVDLLLSLDEVGRVTAVEPFERPAGVRLHTASWNFGSARMPALASVGK